MRWGTAATRVAVAATLLASLAATLWMGFRGDPEPPHELRSLPAFTLETRPDHDRYLFDYAGELTPYEEGVHRFLARMRERSDTEALIVTLPELPRDTYLEELAVDIVDRWRIGGKHGGRGLLLLLIAQDRQVKLEVTYELEDVFTDAFTAHIQDLQLRPYYLAGDLGTGLVAVMEELEQRAALKPGGNYTPSTVVELDAQLLSGGAGARRDLQRYEADRRPFAASADRPRRGARSPEEAWETMVAKWAGHGREIDVDVYTEMTKLEMGEPDDADPRTRRSVEHWRDAEYRVLQDETHAVIWFGNLEGWNNAPFLFCRTEEGWKFDIVHQRRLVVMAESPHWMIEQGDYPYVDLLEEAPRSRGKDLPLPKRDRYACSRDAEIAAQIRALERARQRSPDDVAVLLDLARLNIITGRRPRSVQPLLRRLRQLAPDNADVYKYAAIYNVHSFFQYETALREMQIYARLRPREAFAHSFIGFLHYQLRNYAAAEESLEQAIEIAPDDGYAEAWLARSRARGSGLN